MSGKDELYEKALQGKKIPILTLDNKWYKLFPNLNDYPKILKLARNLNDLLKRQGKLNTETKDIKNIKMHLMQEIVPMVNELEQNSDKALEKKIEDHKRLIEESNERLEAYQDELIELPGMIEKANHELMLATMEFCYENMSENTDEILRIAEWVANIREELKNNLVIKQEKEIYNRQMYSYMHDIFGADVIEMFDMKYNPLEQAPRKTDENM
ncbi:MAG: hypothetical protein IKK33_12975 [Lachnospiraceae bacterium]|nr:hypothetical protein [Lachnospiraceae bacterium]